MFHLMFGPGSSTLLLIFQRCSFGFWDRIVEAEMSWTFVQHGNCNTRSENQAKLDGYSFPLGAKIIETLLKRPERFHIRTLCILRHNTRRDPEGNAYPIFHGFMVSFSSMSCYWIFREYLFNQDSLNLKESFRFMKQRWPFLSSLQSIYGKVYIIIICQVLSTFLCIFINF